MAFTHGGRVESSDGRYVERAVCAGCTVKASVTKFNGKVVRLCWSCERIEWQCVAENEANSQDMRAFARENVRRMNRGLEPKVWR